MHKSNCRDASPPLLNHGFHAIDATSARRRVVVWSLAARFSQHGRVLAEKRVPDSLVDLRAGRDPFSGEEAAPAARVVADRGLIYASGIARQGRQGDSCGGCDEEAATAGQDAAPETADAAADTTT